MEDGLFSDMYLFGRLSNENIPGGVEGGLIAFQLDFQSDSFCQMALHFANSHLATFQSSYRT